VLLTGGVGTYNHYSHGATNDHPLTACHSLLFHACISEKMPDKELPGPSSSQKMRSVYYGRDNGLKRAGARVPSQAELLLSQQKEAQQQQGEQERPYAYAQSAKESALVLRSSRIIWLSQTCALPEPVLTGCTVLYL
jgi:hypothetical protein